MQHLQEIDRTLKELKERRNDLINELEALPEGEFLCYYSHGVKCYCERIPARGNVKKEKRIGVAKNKNRLYGLVRKEYVNKAIKIIDKDIRILETTVKRYQCTDENSVMGDFAHKHPELQEGIYYGTTSDEEWMQQKSDESSFYKEALTSISADGSGRRSLAELIIGGKLMHYGIAYRYEAPLSHPDLRGRYSPDFTIRRPRDGKIIYWEHFGMVNNEEYMKKNKIKLEEYEKYGIVPWDNLIVTYSQQDTGLNEKLIDSLINGWLL